MHFWDLKYRQMQSLFLGVFGPDRWQVACLTSYAGLAHKTSFKTFSLLFITSLKCWSMRAGGLLGRVLGHPCPYIMDGSHLKSGFEGPLKSLEVWGTTSRARLSPTARSQDLLDISSRKGVATLLWGLATIRATKRGAVGSTFHESVDPRESYSWSNLQKEFPKNL